LNLLSLLFRLRSSGGASQTPAASAATSNVPASSSAVSSSGSKAADPPNKRAVQGVFTFFNLGFMVFLAATGALGVGGADSSSDAGVVFVGIYLIVFAGVVFIFELAQLCPDGTLDTIMKKNFGFLYGIVGKGMFILL
jgi:hypothetical protein